jgi:hypothetical protein
MPWTGSAAFDLQPNQPNHHPTNKSQPQPTDRHPQPNVGRIPDVPTRLSASLFFLPKINQKPLLNHNQPAKTTEPASPANRS